MRSRIVVLALVACAVAAPAIANPRESGPRLDDTFGRGGVVVLRAPSQTHSRRTFVPRSWVLDDAVVDRDGRVWALYNGTAAASSVLAAYDADGGLDRAFGHDGVLALGVLGGFGKVTLDSAGRIILLGAPARSPSPNPPNGRDAIVVRVLPEGRLDPAFGFGGVQRHESPTLFPMGVYADGEGGVLVVERSSSNLGLPLRYVVFRLGPDGTLDRTYGDDGVAVVPRIGESELEAYTVDATGRFVAVDRSDDSDDDLPPRYALVGLDASGRSDSTLGEQGTRVLDLSARPTPFVRDLEVDAAGRFVVLGGGLAPDTTPFIARYLADGAPDSTWSGTEDGVRDILTDRAQWRTVLRSLTIDGGIYYADGYRRRPYGRYSGDTLVVRVDADTEQTWTSHGSRFKNGFDQVVSVRDDRVLAWSDLSGRSRPKLGRACLVRVRFD